MILYEPTRSTVHSPAGSASWSGAHVKCANWEAELMCPFIDDKYVQWGLSTVALVEEDGAPMVTVELLAASEGDYSPLNDQYAVRVNNARDSRENIYWLHANYPSARDFARDIVDVIQQAWRDSRGY